LLRCFQNYDPSSSNQHKPDDFGDNLLKWVKETLKGYSDIDLKDGFKSEAFRSGKVFAGLINEFEPGKHAVNYKALSNNPSGYQENCKIALHAGEAAMGIPQILEEDELAKGKCNDKQIQLYLSLMYNAYAEKNRGMTKESLQKKIIELEGILVKLLEENAALKESIAKSQQSANQLHQMLTMSTDEHTRVKKQRDDLKHKLHELTEKI
jgi:hypothetical protein